MKIPKKISPDNIKEAIIQIKFEPNCPAELVLGNFNNICSELLDFVSTKVTREENDNLIIENNSGGFFIDKSELFKVEINGESITFNTQVNDYPGWEKYSDFINSVINICTHKELFKQISRVGVRYISHFENITIFDKLKVNISVPFTDLNDSTQFRSEFLYKEYRVILTILNHINNKDIKTSVIDIDVIKQVDVSSKDYDLNESIESSHFTQKEIFFNLLSDEFLKSLNPVY